MPLTTTTTTTTAAAAAATMATKMATAMRSPLSRMQQRRWARVCDVRFVATAKGGLTGGGMGGAHGAGAGATTTATTATTTTTATGGSGGGGGAGAGAGGAFNASVLEKYRAKLHRKAKEHGFDDVTQLREAYKDKIDTLRREQAAALAAGHSAAAATGASAGAGAATPVPYPTPSLPSSSPPPPPPPSSPLPSSSSSSPSSAQHRNAFTPPSSPDSSSLSSTSPFPSSGGGNPSSASSASSASSSSSSSSSSAAPRLPRAAPGPKPLSAYVDVPKLLELPARELESVWRLRHASSPDSLCAVIPAATYARMAARARRHPQFILPLPRRSTSAPHPPPPSRYSSPDATAAAYYPHDARAEEAAAGAEDASSASNSSSGTSTGSDGGGVGSGVGVGGAEIHFLQWSFPTPTTSVVLLTHLAEYKLRGAFSQPHTTVTHHLDLLAPRGVVLLHGHVARGRGVGADDARWLLMCLQKFYGGVGSGSVGGGVGGGGGISDVNDGLMGDAAYTSLPHDRLLEQFTSGAADFRLEELLDHAERFT